MGNFTSWSIRHFAILAVLLVLLTMPLSNYTALALAEPSIDATDDLATIDLSIQDSSQIMELSVQAPVALPAGTPLLPATLVHIIDTSKAAWNPSSPDPSGVDYWPLTNRLLIDDSEVDEMPLYFTGKNVYLSTTSGNLTGTCNTMSFTDEPTGLAINPNNNHIFISTDLNDRVFEIGLGSDGTYCTADDTVTTTDVSALYGVNDAEDVAYGNNTVFVAGGVDAEVYRIPLGTNGVLGGGDDGPMTHFDTAGWGFHDLEGIGFNTDNGTLFIVSTQGSEHYLGEISTTGTFLRAYDLSLMGTDGNIRSDVAYGPGSQNPAVKSIYIASRGLDNDSNRKENDGRIWEINISGSVTFSDVPTNYWAYSSIEQLYAAGITGGCATNPLRYCPETSVTRAQMAVFLERSMKGSSYTPPPATGTMFADVPSSYWAAAWIERLAADGITSGCSTGYYCPDSPVTRAQMAVFLLRAEHGSLYKPPAVGSSTGFNDVPITYWAAAWIKQLAAEGVTQGCGNGNYCPDSPVSRAQMAVFLVTTFNLP